MTALLEQAIRLLENLPDSDQDAAACALMDYLDHRDTTQLTEDQIAEVQRRIADLDRVIVSGDVARARIAAFGS